MSDTKNKTENNTESKTDEVAPYMKQDKQDKAPAESSKSNMVIPLVLLLVSAIVIVATFYEDEYNDLVAEASSATETQTETSASEKPDNNTEAVAQATENNNATAVEIQAVAVNAESPANTEIQAVSTAKQDTMMPPADRVTDTQTRAANHHARMQTAYAPYQRTPYAGYPVNQQSYEQARKEAIARAQEQAKKHDAIMQQRRQAHEKEMQARRQQYEAAMKAQQEKRAKIAETQKAVFQRVEQNRMENNQKMKEMHDEISKMHNEIHQIMRDSQPQYRNNSAPQIQQPATEQLQSI